MVTSISPACRRSESCLRFLLGKFKANYYFESQGYSVSTKNGGLMIFLDEVMSFQYTKYTCSQFRVMPCARASIVTENLILRTSLYQHIFTCKRFISSCWSIKFALGKVSCSFYKPSASEIIVVIGIVRGPAFDFCPQGCRAEWTHISLLIP